MLTVPVYAIERMIVEHLKFTYAVENVTRDTWQDPNLKVPKSQGYTTR